MLEYQPNKRTFVERRRKKDWVTRLIPIFSAVGWLSVVVFIFLLERASPRTGDIFTTKTDLIMVSGINSTLLRTSLAVLILVFLVCVLGFFFNMFRHRRKSDKYNLSIIILGLLSMVGIIVFILVYGRYL